MDANYAGNIDEKKSISAFAQMVGVTWLYEKEKNSELYKVKL